MYKILSLDGGGCWSILQLLTLKEMYGGSALGHEVLKDFDMVVANSGGSIGLAALAENFSIDEAVELFNEERKRKSIFSKNSFWERSFPVDFIRLFDCVDLGPKYATAKKREAFGVLLPKVASKKMNEIPEYIGKKDLKLVVCTYDALLNRARFFTSYPKTHRFGDEVKNSKKEEYATLGDAIHGSSNAPIQYFDFPAKVKTDTKEHLLWDGALGGFNNPVVAGIVEVLKEKTVDPAEICVLSLGTGNKVMSDKDQKGLKRMVEKTERSAKNKLLNLGQKWRYFKSLIKNQAQTILYEPPDWANYVAYMFLRAFQGENPKFVRLSPFIRHTLQNQTSQELIHQLYCMQMDAAEEEEVELLNKCFDLWKKGVIENQPIRYAISELNEVEKYFGHLSFEEAVKQWKGVLVAV